MPGVSERLLGGAGPIRQRLFASAMARFGGKAEQYLEPYKTRLLGDLSGTVLEIGAGAGANLRYFLNRPVKWIGVEPNRFMLPHLMREARRAGIEVEVCEGAAENLPLASASVDAVVSTLVLCSVLNLPRVLAEILRVLRPGGKFVFIEHVAAPQGTWLRRVQRWVRPLWQRMGDGCHPDRETGRALEDSGFAKVTIERFDAPLPVVRPHIAGVAVKAG
jgi:ubiquinone/menaquinone biosynthesis C-methylase UbiE